MPGNKINDYEVICTIGSGAYGTCKKIRRRADGKVKSVYNTVSLTKGNEREIFLKNN